MFVCALMPRIHLTSVSISEMNSRTANTLIMRLRHVACVCVSVWCWRIQRTIRMGHSCVGCLESLIFYFLVGISHMTMSSDSAQCVRAVAIHFSRGQHLIMHQSFRIGLLKLKYYYKWQTKCLDTHSHTSTNATRAAFGAYFLWYSLLLLVLLLIKSAIEIHSVDSSMEIFHQCLVGHGDCCWWIAGRLTTSVMIREWYIYIYIEKERKPSTLTSVHSTLFISSAFGECVSARARGTVSW